jgi:hypothetical protein
MIELIMRSRGCSRAEAADMLASMPDAPARSGD